MDANEEAPQKYVVTAVCTVTDPAERRRRLAQAYDLILEFGRQKKAAAKVAPADDGRPVG